MPLVFFGGFVIFRRLITGEWVQAIERGIIFFSVQGLFYDSNNK